jgi:isocitrate dehydrogenase
MERIKMSTAIAELDGDEMTRILWALIKERLLEPFIDLKTEYYDLSLENRDKTGDAVTVEAAKAIKHLGVGVKCATITSNAARQEEYHLKELHPSPNATIRAILDGTVFRKPIQLDCLQSTVTSWKKPIVIGRHAYGDVYKAAEMVIPGPGTVELVYRPAASSAAAGETTSPKDEIRVKVMDMPSAGVVQAMHNLDESIANFARCCFRYALSESSKTVMPVWFASKDTISKTYDGRFKELFARVYEEEFKAECDKAGIEYFYTLIDDAVARVMKSEGGFLWACKNYDGDVMSDMIASAAGSLAMMSSVLVSPSGCFEYEAAHGTVQRHYYRYLKGEKPGTNPVALIFAWTGALKRRAELDALTGLGDFAEKLENASLSLISEGYMTGDLAGIANNEVKARLDSWEFIDKIAERLA